LKKATTTAKPMLESAPLELQMREEWNSAESESILEKIDRMG
jgi:hypothetical protein